MVGGVGLNFTTPVGYIGTKLGRDGELPTNTRQKVVSSLVSIAVPQNAVKNPIFFDFFLFFCMFLLVIKTLTREVSQEWQPPYKFL